MNAPLDLGAYALAETRHQVIAAPYHRNNAGNRALYDFFRAPPDRAVAIAAAWRVDYLAYCPGDLASFPPPAPNAKTMAAWLGAGGAVAWLEPIATGDPSLRIYRFVAPPRVGAPGKGRGGQATPLPRAPRAS